MPGNFEYIITRPGIAKIFTIVIGAIVVGLSIYGHYETEWHYYQHSGFIPPGGINPEFYFEERELLLIWVSAIALVVSLVLLIVPSLSDPFATNKISRVIDGTFHFAAGIAIIIGGSLMIYNAVDIDKLTCRIYEFGGGGLPFLGRNARSFGGLGSLFGGGGFGGGFGPGIPFGAGVDAVDSCRDIYNYPQKLGAGIVALVNGLIYIITGIFVITSNVE